VAAEGEPGKNGPLVKLSKGNVGVQFGELKIRSALLLANRADPTASGFRPSQLMALVQGSRSLERPTALACKARGNAEFQPSCTLCKIKAELAGTRRPVYLAGALPEYADDAHAGKGDVGTFP
jgi:hypothetical protein